MGNRYIECGPHGTIGYKGYGVKGVWVYGAIGYRGMGYRTYG